MDLVGAVRVDRNLAPYISCGLGTDWYRDISIDCCADTWLLMTSLCLLAKFVS